MRFKKIITTIICFALFMTTIGFQNVTFAEELTDVSEETTDEDEITADTSVIDEEVDDGITIEEVNDTDIELLKDYEETDVENTDEFDDVFDEEADLNNVSYVDEAVALNFDTKNYHTFSDGVLERKVYTFTVTNDALLHLYVEASANSYDNVDYVDAKLFNEKGSEIATSEFWMYKSVPYDEWDMYRCLDKGTYYLVFWNDSDPETDKRHRDIGIDSITIEATLTYLNSSEKEKNDNIENAQDIKAGKYYGTFNHHDKYDTYKVVAKYKGDIQIDFNAYWILDSYVELTNYVSIYNSKGELISEKKARRSSSGGGYFCDSASLVTSADPGIYYIQIEGDWDCFYDFTVSLPSLTNGTISTTGIYCASNYPSIQAGINIQKSNESDTVEYRWVGCDNSDPEHWFEISPWTKDNNWMVWTPKKSGGYVFVCYARVVGNEEASEISYAFGTEHHKTIKGICQMPYTGEGGGYLIGIESFDNPNHSYKYEMLILDCNLYMQGKDAWVYTTGKCGAPENCLWTIWQPQYGYYWTLFRIYDQNDNLIDEACYGFENVY